MQLICCHSNVFNSKSIDLTLLQFYGAMLGLFWLFFSASSSLPSDFFCIDDKKRQSSTLWCNETIWFLVKDVCDLASNIQFIAISLNEEGFLDVIGVNFRSWFTFTKALRKLCLPYSMCGVLMNSTVWFIWFV